MGDSFSSVDVCSHPDVCINVSLRRLSGQRQIRLRCELRLLRSNPKPLPAEITPPFQATCFCLSRACLGELTVVHQELEKGELEKKNQGFLLPCDKGAGVGVLRNSEDDIAHKM